MAFNGKMSGKSELSTFSGSLYLNIPKWWATGDLFRRASKEIPKKENFEVTFEASQDQIIYIVKRKKGNQPTGSKPSRPKIKPKKEVVPEKERLKEVVPEKERLKEVVPEKERLKEVVPEKV